MIVCLIEKHIVGKFVKIISYLLELLDKWPPQNLHATTHGIHLCQHFTSTFASWERL